MTAETERSSGDVNAVNAQSNQWGPGVARTNPCARRVGPSPKLRVGTFDTSELCTSMCITELW